MAVLKWAGAFAAIDRLRLKRSVAGNREHQDRAPQV
jgi:hypothetical protein